MAITTTFGVASPARRFNRDSIEGMAGHLGRPTSAVVKAVRRGIIMTCDGYPGTSVNPRFGQMDRLSRGYMLCAVACELKRGQKLGGRQYRLQNY